MAEMTKPTLIRTLKRYMDNGDERSARNFYNNYYERFKITESLEQLIKPEKEEE